MMQSFTALLRHELLLARKQGGGFGAALSFILAVIVLVPLSLGPDAQLLSRIAPGLMWLALLLAVMLTAERVFQQDMEDGTLDILAMGALPVELVVMAKSVAHWLSVSLPLALIAPPLGLMLNINTASLPVLWASMILGSLSLSNLACLGGAITAGLKRGGLLVAILILPLYVPVLIFGASVTTLMMGPASALSALWVLAGLALLTSAIVPIAAAAALRAYLR